MLALKAHKDKTRLAQELLAVYFVPVLNMAAKTTIRIEQFCPWLEKPMVFTPAMFGGDLAAMNRAIIEEQERRDFGG